MTRAARRSKEDKPTHEPSSSWGEMVKDLPKSKRRKTDATIVESTGTVGKGISKIPAKKKASLKVSTTENSTVSKKKRETSAPEEVHKVKTQSKSKSSRVDPAVSEHVPTPSQRGKSVRGRGKTFTQRRSYGQEGNSDGKERSFGQPGRGFGQARGGERGRFGQSRRGSGQGRGGFGRAERGGRDDGLSRRGSGRGRGGFGRAERGGRGDGLSRRGSGRGRGGFGGAERGGRDDGLSRRQRSEEQSTQRKTNLVCFCCRKRGHAMTDCTETDAFKCFRCGSEEHTTKDCAAGIEGYPHATCFICHEVGHIARMCPDNPKGIYPEGGGCKFCGSVEHKRANCPRRDKNKRRPQQDGLTTIGEGSADAEFQAKKQPSFIKKKAGPKVVTF